MYQISIDVWKRNVGNADRRCNNVNTWDDNDAMDEWIVSEINNSEARNQEKIKNQCQWRRTWEGNTWLVYSCATNVRRWSDKESREDVRKRHGLKLSIKLWNVWLFMKLIRMEECNYSTNSLKKGENGRKMFVVIVILVITILELIVWPLKSGIQIINWASFIMEVLIPRSQNLSELCVYSLQC